jgi:magnesium-transporting ATPase (P-type)
MITGDNLTTAIAIAKESGILVEGEELEKYTAMEGPEFAKFAMNKEIYRHRGQTSRP